MLLVVGLLIVSNCFMTLAWYGHLKKAAWTIPVAILLSWLIALPEYAAQVPANRLGHFSQGGPFTAPQLKIIQEVISISVFIVFSIWVLRERPRIYDVVAFGLIILAVAIAMFGRMREVPDDRAIAEAHGTPAGETAAGDSAASGERE